MLNAHTYTLTIKKTNQKLHTQFKTTHTHLHSIQMFISHKFSMPLLIQKKNSFKILIF